MAAKDPDSSVSRRTVLRTVGATGAASSGLALSTASGAAESEYASTLQKLEEQYTSEQVIRQAIEEQASSILQSLAEEGIIDDASASALPTTESIDIDSVEPADGGDGVAVTSIVEEDQPTGFIAVSQTTPEYDLSLYVQPEREDAYAYVTDEDGVRLFQAAESSDEPSAKSVTLQDCDEVCYESRCTSDSCYIFWNVGIDYRCCVDSSGDEECNRTGTSGCQCGDRVCE